MQSPRRIHWPLVLVGLTLGTLGWLALEFDWWRLRAEWGFPRRRGPVRDFFVIVVGALLVGLGLAGVGRSGDRHRNSEVGAPSSTDEKPPSGGAAP